MILYRACELKEYAKMINGKKTRSKRGISNLVYNDEPYVHFFTYAESAKIYKINYLSIYAIIIKCDIPDEILREASIGYGHYNLGYRVRQRQFPEVALPLRLFNPDHIIDETDNMEKDWLDPTFFEYLSNLKGEDRFGTSDMNEELAYETMKSYGILEHPGYKRR